jgi:hypothetical protein
MPVVEEEGQSAVTVTTDSRLSKEHQTAQTRSYALAWPKESPASPALARTHEVGRGGCPT